ncbi:MAG: SGNH/GDSL hydrolase family protein [Ferruginibacter sp.]
MKILITLLGLLTATAAHTQDWPNLKRYAAENAALPAPGKKEKRVVFMGNSITEGWIKADSAFFQKNGFVNRGISGQTTSQMLVRFRPDVIALKPSLVVILAGINDIAENTGPIALKDVAGNIFSMAELAKANGIKVLICSVLPANRFGWRKDIQPADKVIALNNMLKTYCTENKIGYVDYYSPLVDDAKGLDARYGSDGVHPNTAGYAIMKTALEAALKKFRIRVQ